MRPDLGSYLSLRVHQYQQVGHGVQLGAGPPTGEEVSQKGKALPQPEPQESWTVRSQKTFRPWPWNSEDDQCMATWASEVKLISREGNWQKVARTQEEWEMWPSLGNTVFENSLQ